MSSITNQTSYDLNGMEKVCVVDGSWVTICYAAHMIGDPNVILKNIRHRILYLLKRHPRMRAQLSIDNFQVSIKILDYENIESKVDLFYSTGNIHEKSWESHAEIGCDINPYRNDSKDVFPLFRFLFLFDRSKESSTDAEFHILLFSDHCVSDGRSGFIIFNDLLTFSDSSDRVEQVEPVNYKVLPCIQELLPRSHNIIHRMVLAFSTAILKREAKKLRHSHIPVKPVRLNDNQNDPKSCFIKSNFLFISTSRTLYSRLHNKCRSQQITLQGPLVSCLILALDRYFPMKQKHRKSHNLIPQSIGFAVDMRGRLPRSELSSETVGFYIAASELRLKSSYPYRNTSFWSLATEYVRRTNRSIEKAEPELFMKMFGKLISEERTYRNVSQYYPNGHFGEISLSNIGRYPYSTEFNHGELKLTGMHIVNGSSKHFLTGVFYATCVGNGSLDFSLAHNINDHLKARELLQYFVRLLEACADAPINVTLEELIQLVDAQ